MKLRMPHPRRAARARRALEYSAMVRAIVESSAAILNHKGIKHTLTVRHEPRPPAPRPQRLTIVWIMQNGQEMRQYINLYGQTSWTESVPQWVTSPEAYGYPAHSMRFEFGYEDGHL